MSTAKTYYQLGYLLFVMAALGLAGFYFPGIFKSIPVRGRVSRQEEGGISRTAPFAADKFAYGTLIAFCFFFISGMMYQIHQTYIITGHIITGGWYLYAIVIPQLLLLSFGIEVLFGARWQ
jgi:hypothetical protein